MPNHSKKLVKVAITGAAGQIGYALLFRIASGQMFGPDTQVQLNLLELEPALAALHGVAMELDDCAFPLLTKVVCTSDPAEAFLDANWVLLVGAVPRKDGMERADLLKINGSVFGPQGAAINEHAAADVRVLVVGNPCNTNALIAMHHAPRVAHDRFYAMTMLDENRARGQLAIRSGMPVGVITHMAIWGNHSTTQYPDFYNAKINGKKVTDMLADEMWLRDEFIPLIQKRGAQVIKARGASSAASAANGVVDTVRKIINDTPGDDYFSVALCSNGEYSVDPGLLFSYPCRVKNGILSVVTNIQHNDFGLEKIQASLAELRAEYTAVKELGLVK